MLVALLGLGLWQLQRLDEKTTFLDLRQQRFDAAPMELPANDDQLPDSAWRRIAVTGTFDHAHEIHLYRPRGGENGYDVLTPLLPGGDGLRPVLVNRGWVPEQRKDPATRAEAQTAGMVTVTGYLDGSLGIRGRFTPENEPERNQWFWADFDAISARVGLQVRELVLVADATPNPGGFPLANPALPDIPNNHLQYALTWFALAAALVVFWLLLGVRGRQGPDAAPASPNV